MRRAWLSLCIVLAFSGSVSALEHYQFAQGAFDVGTSGSISFSQFDLSLGTLTEAKVYISTSVDAIIVYINTSDTEDWSGGSTSFDLSASLSGTFLGQTVVSDSGSVENAVWPSVFVQAGSRTSVPVIDYVSDSALLTYTSAADLATFTGSGTMSVALTSSGSASITPPTLPSYIDTEEAHRQYAQVSVTYTYTPEPGTLGLLALGGSMLIRRRR